ncbi:MAG: PstS family phosphate ABC transporter substrate-binding protein [Planctomycetota bacterium]|jgi:phosphate transport system substrate-binding protein|nr:PstS family phosphate ABC transporter substrate-binding protein [Planctomycetota bacterium]
MKTKNLSILALFALATACGGGVNGASRTVIQNKGSDTLLNVAQAWAEAYSTINPDCTVAVSGGGSGTGISAMINATVDIANASRKMKERELAAAGENGVTPQEFVVGYDALAIYVHADNPIESITMEQLAQVFGEGGELERWSQLGVTMARAADDEIVRVSRQNNSGTFIYFREAVLGKQGNYKLGSLDMHGSKDVVDLVENTPGAIGYSGLAYATAHVKLVPVVSAETGAPVQPSVDTAVDRTYPIARPLFMYTAGRPEGAVGEYLEWILSDEGQRIILAKGYASVRALE